VDLPWTYLQTTATSKHGSTYTTKDSEEVERLNPMIFGTFRSKHRLGALDGWCWVLVK